MEHRIINTITKDTSKDEDNAYILRVSLTLYNITYTSIDIPMELCNGEFVYDEEKYEKELAEIDVLSVFSEKPLRVICLEFAKKFLEDEDLFSITDCIELEKNIGQETKLYKRLSTEVEELKKENESE